MNYEQQLCCSSTSVFYQSDHRGTNKFIFPKSIGLKYTTRQLINIITEEMDHNSRT